MQHLTMTILEVLYTKKKKKSSMLGSSTFILKKDKTKSSNNFLKGLIYLFIYWM